MLQSLQMTERRLKVSILQPFKQEALLSLHVSLENESKFLWNEIFGNVVQL